MVANSKYRNDLKLLNKSDLCSSLKTSVNFEFAKVVFIQDALFDVMNLVLDQWIDLKEWNHPSAPTISKKL